MTELGEQRARQQRVDLVVLGDQDREALAGDGRARRARELGSRRRHRRTVVAASSRAASEAARTGLTR